MADSKTLTIKIAADQNTTKQTDNVLRGLISTFEKLISQANRLSAVMANLGNGGSMQGATMGSASKGSSGVGSMGATMPGIVRGRMGIIGNLFGMTSASDASSLGSATVNALGSVESKIKSFVSTMTQQLGTLNQAVTGATEKLGDMGDGGKPGYYWAKGEWWRDKKRGGRGGNVPSREDVPGADTKPEDILPTAANLPPRRRGGGAGRGRGGGGGGGEEGPRGLKGEEIHPYRLNPLAQYGQTGGIIAGAFPAISPIFSAANIGLAGIGVAARYGLGKGEEFNEWMVGQRLSGLNRELNLPSEILQRRAEGLAPFRNVIQSYANRDWASQMAWERTFANKPLEISLKDTEGRKARLMHEKFGIGTLAGASAEAFDIGHRAVIDRGIGGFLAPANDPGHTLAETGKGLVQDVLHPLNALWNFGRDFYEGAVRSTGVILGGTSEALYPSLDKKTGRQRAKEDAVANLENQRAAELEAAHQHELDLQDPYYQAAAANIFGNFKGRYASNRATGVSAKLVKDPNTGELIPGDYKAREEMERRGRDYSEIAGGRQTLFGIGRGYGAAYGERSDMMLSHGEMGLQQFPQLLKLGGILSGVVGSKKDPRGAYRFIDKTLQGMIGGAGGIDPIIGQELAATYGEQALKAGAAANAEDLIRQMASFTKYQTNDLGFAPGVYDAAGQGRRALEAQGGFDIMGKYTQGTLAPLYKALAIQSAIKANGGTYDYSAEAYLQLAPQQLWSIQQGGKIPAGLKDMVTQEGAKIHLAEALRNSFVEVDPTRIGAKDVYGKKVIGEIEAANGDVGLALYKHLSALQKNGATRKQLRDEEQNWIVKSGQYSSLVTGQNAMGQKGFEELVGHRYEEVLGTGVGIVGQSEEQKAAGEQQGETTHEEGTTEALKVGDELKAAHSGRVKAAHEAWRKSKPTLTGIPGATDDLVFALNAFKSAIVSSHPSGDAPGRVTPP